MPYGILGSDPKSNVLRPADIPGVNNSGPEWNSPEHWIRSDMTTALARGELDKAKILGDTLKTTLAPGMAADVNAAEVQKTKLGIQPQMAKVAVDNDANKANSAIFEKALGALFSSEGKSPGGKEYDFGGWHIDPATGILKKVAK